MELSENAAIKEIKEVFASDNESLIHDTISYIHENGSTKMLPLLFELLEHTNSESIKQDIFNCLADAKDVNSIPFFIDALNNQDLKNYKGKILSVMWQANIDFSAHTNLFTDILINDNYETAIEAFTILEVCASNLSEFEKKELTSKISTAISHEKSEKLALLQEAIHCLE